MNWILSEGQQLAKSQDKTYRCRPALIFGVLVEVVLNPCSDLERDFQIVGAAENMVKAMAKAEKLERINNEVG